MSGLLETPWKSLNKKHLAQWQHEKVQELAEAIREAMPKSVVALLETAALKSNAVLMMDNVASAKGCDLRANAVALRPLIEHFPVIVPTHYFIADVMMELDRMFDNKLTTPRSDISRDSAMVTPTRTTNGFAT